MQIVWFDFNCICHKKTLPFERRYDSEVNQHFSNWFAITYFSTKWREKKSPRCEQKTNCKGIKMKIKSNKNTQNDIKYTIQINVYYAAKVIHAKHMPKHQQKNIHHNKMINGYCDDNSITRPRVNLFKFMILLLSPRYLLPRVDQLSIENPNAITSLYTYTYLYLYIYSTCTNVHTNGEVNNGVDGKSVYSIEKKMRSNVRLRHDPIQSENRRIDRLCVLLNYMQQLK